MHWEEMLHPTASSQDTGKVDPKMAFDNYKKTTLKQDAMGYLHPEVGIDLELERLLAENPGLYMEDQPDTSEELTVHVPKKEK